MNSIKRQYKKLKCEKFKNNDVFKSFLVENASYDGDLEMPILNGSSEIPYDLVLFSKAKNLMEIINGFAFMKMIVKLKVSGIILGNIYL